MTFFFSKSIPPLVTNIQSIVQNYPDLLVTILFQGNVTLNKKDIQEIITLIVDRLNGCMIQVVQYATVTRIECPFTNDQVKLKDSINGIKLLKCGGNLNEALKVVKNSYSRYMSTNSKPFIIMINLGNYEGENPTIGASEFMGLVPTPKIINISVTPFSDQVQLNLPKEIENIHLSKFSHLKSQVDSITHIKPKKSADPPLRITFNCYGDKLLKSRDNLTLEYKVEPEAYCHRIPTGSEIKFLPNDYYYGEVIQIMNDVTRATPLIGTVTFKPKPSSIPGDVPDILWFDAIVNGHTYKGSVSLLLGWFAGDFIHKIEKDLNILVYGYSGCGKTSLINSMATVLGPSQNVNYKLMGMRLNGHVTTEYSCHSLGSLVEDVHNDPLSTLLKQHIKINIWDTWGLERDLYDKLGIEHFLSGQVEPGTVMTNQLQYTPINQDNAIHGVILIIPIGTAHSRESLRNLAANVKTIMGFGIRPVIMINFIDTVESEQNIKDSYEKILRECCLSPNDIFLLDNYYNEKYRNIVKDMQIFKMMKKVYGESLSNLQKMYGESKSMGTQNILTKLKELQLKPIPTSIVLNKTPSTSSTSTTHELSRVCLNNQCSNVGKPVQFKMCLYCGSYTNDLDTSSTPLPTTCTAPTTTTTSTITSDVSRIGSQNLFVGIKEIECTKPGCNYKGKPSPFCPNCGSDTFGSPSQPIIKYCRTKDCVDYDKKIDTPFCPQCGSYPEEKITLVCGTNSCLSFSKPITTPRCPYCGNAPVKN